MFPVSMSHPDSYCLQKSEGDGERHPHSKAGDSFQGHRSRLIPLLAWILQLAACELRMEPRPLRFTLFCSSSW